MIGKSRVTDSVPTILITGTVGSGKTSVASEVSDILISTDVPHALLDLDWLGRVYPGHPDDHHNQRLIVENLSAIWPNLRRAHARRLVLARVIEDRSGLDAYEKAIPGAAITIVRLKASSETLKERIQAREEGDLSREWHLARTIELDLILDKSRPEDHLVVNEGKSLNEVAREVLAVVGWHL
ncbi:MAG TPA: AAA family ATPase [Actinomycetota bacterium]|nr:AAA family ATPase [Actinomycetota bacterium]